MSEVPKDVKFGTINDSIAELEFELNGFVAQWEANKNQTIRNPFLVI